MADARRASPGVRFPPPTLFVVGFLVALALERWLLSLRFSAGTSPALPLTAWVLIALGMGLIAWAMLTFRRARTAIMPFNPASTIVTSGPYRFSRNPMYVGADSRLRRPVAPRGNRVADRAPSDRPLVALRARHSPRGAVPRCSVRRRVWCVSATRPPVALVRRSLLVGALAGAVLLGGGTRIAMRGVALIEGRVPTWTLTGTLQVMMYGALFGLGFALLWMLVGRRLPGNRFVRGLLFGVLTAVVASPGLTPRRLSTFLLFTPWFLLYGWRCRCSPREIRQRCQMADRSYGAPRPQKRNCRIARKRARITRICAVV